MLRSTKIVATLGPASSDPAVLERMVRAGVDVVRLNFSHGTAQDHENRAKLVKEIATKTGRTVAILCSERMLFGPSPHRPSQCIDAQDQADEDQPQPNGEGEIALGGF